MQKWGARQRQPWGGCSSARVGAALGFWTMFSNHLSTTRVPLALLVLLAKMESTVSLAPLVPLVLEVALVIAVLLYVAPHPLPHAPPSPGRLEYH